MLTDHCIWHTNLDQPATALTTMNAIQEDVGAVVAVNCTDGQSMGAMWHNRNTAM